MVSVIWRIVATDDYIADTSQLSIGIQDQIQKSWIEVSKHQNPRDVGSTDVCDKHDSYVVVIFAGLEYKFVYKMDETEQIIRLLSCRKLTILDHGQTE
ncbi:MAG: hypothetical protein WA941_11480 [Nitrososphaeraceae archaeon]